MSSSAQRKTTESPLVSRPRTRAAYANRAASRAAYASRAASRAANANRAISRAAYASRAANANRTANMTSDGDPAPPTETIDVMDTTDDSVGEVVDLTSEGSEAAAAVVDLTNNDSVLLENEGPQNRRVAIAESYVVSSDEDDTTLPVNPAILRSKESAAARSISGTFSCPVCLDSYSEIMANRLIVSTNCGHVFCSKCLKAALSVSPTCPVCRKRLTRRQYHPLYF